MCISLVFYTLKLANFEAFDTRNKSLNHNQKHIQQYITIQLSIIPTNINHYIHSNKNSQGVQRLTRGRKVRGYPRAIRGFPQPFQGNVKSYLNLSHARFHPHLY